MQRILFAATLVAPAAADVLEVHQMHENETTVCTGACIVKCEGAAACQNSTVVCAPDQPCWILCTSGCGDMSVSCPGDGRCFFNCPLVCPLLMPDLFECTGSGCDDAVRQPTIPSARCEFDDLDLAANAAAVDPSKSADACKPGEYLRPKEFCAMANGLGSPCESAFCTEDGAWAVKTIECPACLWESSGAFPAPFVQLATGEVCDPTAGACPDPVRCSSDATLCVGTAGDVCVESPPASAAPKTCAPPPFTFTPVTPEPAAPPPEESVAPAPQVPSDAPPRAPLPPGNATGAPAAGEESDAPLTSDNATDAPAAGGESDAPFPSDNATVAAEELPTIDVGVVEGAVAVAGVALSPGAAKLMIVSHLDCSLDDVDFAAAEPLPWTIHPLGVPIGTTPHRFYLGAVVFDCLLLAVVPILQLLLSAGLHKLHPAGFPTKAAARAAVRYPSVGFVPFLFLYPGISMSSANIVFRPGDGTPETAIFGCLCFAACAALPLVVYRYVLRPRVFYAECIESVDDDADADADRGQPPPPAPKVVNKPQGKFLEEIVERDPGNRQSLAPKMSASDFLLTFRGVDELPPDETFVLSDNPAVKNGSNDSASPAGKSTWRAAICNGILRFLQGSTEWVTVRDQADTRFVEKYGVVFEGYRDTMQNFVFAEMASSLFIGTLSAFHPRTLAQCHIRNSSVVISLAVFQVAVTYWRPYATAFDNTAAIFFSTAATFAVGFMAVGIRLPFSHSDTAQTLLDFSTGLMVISALPLCVKALVDLVFLAFDLRKRFSAFIAGESSGTVEDITPPPLCAELEPFVEPASLYHEEPAWEVSGNSARNSRRPSRSDARAFSPLTPTSGGFSSPSPVSIFSFPPSPSVRALHAPSRRPSVSNPLRKNRSKPARRCSVLLVPEAEPLAPAAVDRLSPTAVNPTV
ncbi:hypothetical protein DIPPA_07187 [Diplonema papillatum]|nr:hypothetical protein DIPPA_07187 [Diplonema papillatum]